MSLTPAQCRAARALIGWSQQDLEQASRVAKKTIADFERGARNPFPRTLDDLVDALEKAGVEFTQAVDELHGSGVRFKWGSEERHQRVVGAKSNEADATNGGLSNAPWDDGFDEDAVANTEIFSQGLLEKGEIWRITPVRWASLSDISRHILTMSLRSDRLRSDKTER